MNKIVIDTNILYSWTGLSVNDKFTPIQIEKFSMLNELYFTTPSIVEFLVKFKNDFNSIKKCLKPIIDKKLTVINIGFIPVSLKVIMQINSSDSLQQISSIIDELIDLKIQKEAEMLRFLLFCILAGMFNVVREDRNYKFQNQQQDSLFIHSSNVLLVSNSSYVYERFIVALRKGYSSNTEQKSVKEIFSVLLRTMMYLWIMNYYFAKHFLLLDDFKNPNPKKLADCFNDFRTDNLHNKLSKYIDNPFAILSKSRFHPLSDNFISQLKNHLENHDLITDEALKYILFRLNKTFQEGAKINKNDVIDLLILYSLSLKGFKFITLDKRLSESIKMVDSDSYKLINSLNLID